jgi:hypothetical protein
MEADSPPTHSPRRPHSHIQRLEQELANWDKLWREAIEQLTRVTPFPSVLVCDPESQRVSLELLIQEVCKIALHPRDSPDYRELSGRFRENQKEIELLRSANSSLKDELETLRNSHEREMVAVSKRIDRFQSMVTEIIQMRAQQPSRIHESPLSPIPVQSAVPEKVVHFKAHRAKSVGARRTPTLDSFTNPHLNDLIARYTKSPRTPKNPRVSLYERSVKDASQSARSKK